MAKKRTKMASAKPFDTKKRRRWISAALLFLSQQNPSHALYMQRAYRTEFAQAPEMWDDIPVIVEDVLDKKEIKQWKEHIFTRSQREAVQVHKETAAEWDKLMPLQHALKTIQEKSTHSTPLAATSIGSSCSTDQLPLYDTLHELFVNDHTNHDDTMDWMACFAGHIPIHDSLTVEGQGASCIPVTASPYTKMILCLEGHSLIRVVPPSEWLELCSDSDDRIAWDGEYDVSWGQQLPPDWSLFAMKHDTVAEEQEDNDEDDSLTEEERLDQLQEWAENPQLFHPNFALITREDKVEDNSWHSSVLLPGDVAVIPAGWWYQTYNANTNANDNSATVCVHSQRCGGSDKGHYLVEHILEQSGATRTYQLEDLLLYGSHHYDNEEENDGDNDNGNNNNDEEYYSSQYYSKTEAQEIVDALFENLEEHFLYNDGRYDYGDDHDHDDDDDDDDDDDTTRESRSRTQNRQKRP